MSKMPSRSMDLNGSRSDRKIIVGCYQVDNFKRSRDENLFAVGYGKKMSDLTDYVRKVGRAGDPGKVFSMERAFLEHEQEHAIRTPEQGKSVNNALTQLAGAEATLAELRDNSERYRNYASTHAIPPKNRIGDLPRDSARDYFRSQRARLTNLRKSPLGNALDYRLYEVRREALQSAEKTYIELQRKALDLPAIAEGRSQGE